ncbi:MAG: glycosyltransferase [Anaerolineales bacterium]|jgi:glycosyltransferase involved in cell wall biosynthesis|nr:glycosyltransferase [Anaerolineales bacterium]
MPISILFSIPNFVTAGSGLVVLDLLRSLDRQEFTPLVCVSRRGGMDVEVARMGAQLICVPFTVSPNPRLSLLTRSAKQAGPFKGLKIDVWHSWHYADDYTEPLIARFAGARKWIYTKKNMSWGSNGWRLRSLLADRIVVNNPRMVDLFFTSPLYRRKIAVIPQGVDTERFHAIPGASGFRASIGIPEQAFLIGCVATLGPNKDHPTLLRAAAALSDKPHIVLIGRGDPEYVASLQGLALELGISDQVHFIGSVENQTLPDVLNQIDTFTLTSRADGLPVALLEAMACERACIATRCGGPEVVISDGRDGFLVDIGDSLALAKIIEQLIRRPALRLDIGFHAREKVIHHFQSQTQNNLYHKLYLQLAQEDSGKL